MTNCVPGVIENLLKEGMNFSNVSAVNMAGEPISVYVQENLDADKIEVRNLYGPTEDTTYSTIYKLENNKPLLIGVPIANTKAYILNKESSLNPIGISGEICLAGAGLARGYLNREELTSEKFVKDPYVKEGRMYRTGDLGRWLPDGKIEYLGRLDHQVKIRGFRIELGEIESVLQQSGLVSQVVVLAPENLQGNKRLVGYIVPKEKFDKAEVMSYLSKRLPEFMVPALWVEMETLPLTSNGKIDKKALPDPDVNELLSNEYAAPRNLTEEKLAAIWKELMDLERAGIYDNFFELGGHSLLAMRVISSVRNEFGSELTIKDFFLRPTIAELASHLETQSNVSVLPAIVAGERPKHIPLSFAQERLWFIDKLEGSAQYHLPSVLRLKGKLNKSALEFALKNIVNRHEVLRTVMIETEGKGYQKVLSKDGWNLNDADGSQFKNKKEDLKNEILRIVNMPFDLSKDHMMRGHLINLGDNDNLLVLTLHHIASDGWSVSILVSELAELYKSFEEKRDAVLDELKVQYADYSIWQRDYLKGVVLESKLDYWKKKLGNAEPLHLPTDFPRPAIQGKSGAVKEFIIDKELTDMLQILSRQYGATLFMTLISVFKVMLFRYSNQNDISVGSPIAGRQQKEIEKLIGFFVSTVVLRSDLKSEETFTELLEQVKSTTLEAYEHQDTPFEKVVEAVVKQRDMSRSPLFQVALGLENTPEVPEIRSGDLVLSNEVIESNISKIDLFFNIKETDKGLQGIIEYCTDLYKEETIERMTTAFQKFASIGCE
jgi:NRPS condensation-like uncharacterized protein/acyl carrier protein